MMGTDVKYRYWLRYFQIPASRSPDAISLAGYPKAKLIGFWKHSNSLQSLVTRFLFVLSFFVMTFFAFAYALMVQKYRNRFSPHAFWSILIVSAIFSQPS